MALSLLLLVTRGYPWMAAGLAVAVSSLAPSLCRQPAAGLVVHWYGGHWYCERDGVKALVRLDRSSRASPLGIYLCWRLEGGKREYAWLFPDSAPADQLRRLRVRLALNG